MKILFTLYSDSPAFTIIITKRGNLPVLKRQLLKVILHRKAELYVASIKVRSDSRSLTRVNLPLKVEHEWRWGSIFLLSPSHSMTKASYVNSQWIFKICRMI